MHRIIVNDCVDAAVALVLVGIVLSMSIQAGVSIRRAVAYTDFAAAEVGPSV
jgi:hypothetical protein